jgi:hypothetical protein
VAVEARFRDDDSNFPGHGGQYKKAMAVAPATVAGLLADEDRLRVFAAVALGARTVADAARAAELGETVVQNVLPRLVQAGLIEQRDGLRVSTATLEAAARARPPRARGADDATAEEQRVLRNFVVDGRLVRLPARYEQKRVVLGYVARRFDDGRAYGEREVNALLREFHDDAAALRRYLVDEGLLERSGGVYRRR